MKKNIFVLTALLFFSSIFAQTNTTVAVSDEVYQILSNAEMRGLCSTLATVRPYTEKYILAKLDEILTNLENLEGARNSYKSATEYEVVAREKERFVRNYEKGFKGDWRTLGFRVDGGWGKIPVSLEFNNSISGFISDGVYSEGGNYFGYEIFDNVSFKGDIGKYVSYSASGYFGFTKMPLEKMGNYDIGYWWYDKVKEGEDGNYKDFAAPFDKNDAEIYKNIRRVNSFRNRSYLPYAFSKYWGGNVWHLGNMNAGGLEDWCGVDSFAFGINAEIHASFFDNRLELGAARIRREWAAMDEGASLIMNAKARPFFAFDVSVHLFPFLSLSGLTGFLEFPNQNFINGDAWPDTDSRYFQNVFSIGQLDLDFKYFHFDFGSTVVWPRRFDITYSMPLIDKVMHQDVIGDYDNLALFFDLKFRYPKVGSLWFSFYLDEMPEMNPVTVAKNMFSLDRYMFALQAGAKVNLPFLPFATLSFRYTKIEPYCYTHHSINYTPWYAHYLSESYVNNGESLGYYLPPNSDEFFVRLEARPSKFSMAALQYQLVRHGADFGSRQVDGSSLYSELPPSARGSMKKYFLKDGAYEWTNIVALQGSYDFKQFTVPVVLSCTLGFVYTFYTDTDSALGEKGSYHRIDTDEYKKTAGFIFTLGFTLFGR